MLAQHRLLDEHQRIGIKLLGQYLGHGPVQAAMKVHRDAEFRPHRLAQRADPFQHRIDLGVAVDPGHFLGRQHLDGGEAPRGHLFGTGHDIVRPVAADPGIDAHLAAHRTTQQRMHRLAQYLALDVPQRLVDARQRAHVKGAATVEAAAIQHGPVIFDGGRVFADQVVGQLGDAGGNGLRTPFHHRLAPASYPGICFHFQEQPARRHHIGGEFGNLHKAAPKPQAFRAFCVRVTAFWDMRKLVAGQSARMKHPCAALYWAHERAYGR